jgi:hypothetical protein
MKCTIGSLVLFPPSNYSGLLVEVGITRGIGQAYLASGSASEAVAELDLARRACGHSPLTISCPTHPGKSTCRPV